MPDWLIMLSGFSAIAYAVLGGVFLAFSDFIMRSLRLTNPPGAIEAMQHINRQVFRHVFIPTFLAMAPISIGVAIAAQAAAEPAPARLLAAAASMYVFGAFLVTIARNVPLNERLDRMDATSGEAEAFWTTTYAPVWTRWNTVRTAACAAAAALALAAVAASGEPARV